MEGCGIDGGDWDVDSQPLIASSKQLQSSVKVLYLGRCRFDMMLLLWVTDF
ncbi:hypothetical protein GCM10009092_14990 [Bowmanella denitrificans]|uniref:Uncharacterized protein n=1 Tax=Bowmanella denitrificans TaxID=366582 RepID=A0ABN0X000_9ALTE